MLRIGDEQNSYIKSMKSRYESVYHFGFGLKNYSLYESICVMLTEKISLKSEESLKSH